MILKIHIKTKDFISLNRFSKLTLKINKFKLFLQLLNNQKKNTHFSILKSPHVNKKAQEQFGYTEFNKCIIVDKVISLNFILFIKKLLNRLFSDLLIRIDVIKLPCNKLQSFVVKKKTRLTLKKSGIKSFLLNLN